MENIETIISTVGFPIAVCCYLLWERQMLIRKFTAAIDDLKIEIVKFCERCNGGKKR